MMDDLVKTFGFKTKRVCLALDLKDNKELIAKYKRVHNEDYWSEIGEGIRAAGILLMDIYLVDNRMVMVCEIAANKDFDQIFDSIKQYPRQTEWEELVSQFQQALPGRELKWIKMGKIFEL